MSEASNTDQHPAGGTPTTGWKVIAGNPSAVEIVDTILDLPPNREFNKSELAEMAGVSRRSIHTYIGTLLQLDIVEPVEGSSPQRYRFDAASDVSEALIRLDGAINRNGPDAE